jgi:hypothetical protein
MRGEQQEQPDKVHATTEAGQGEFRLSDGLSRSTGQRRFCEARYNERKSLTRPEDDRKAAEVKSTNLRLLELLRAPSDPFLVNFNFDNSFPT